MEGVSLTGLCSLNIEVGAEEHGIYIYINDHARSRFRDMFLVCVPVPDFVLFFKRMSATAFSNFL